MHELSVLLFIPPALLFFSAMLGRRLAFSAAYKLAVMCASFALLTALSLAVLVAIFGAAFMPTIGLGFSWLGQSILLLLNFIGLILVRYSKNYLAGEPRQGVFISDLQFTLTAVSITVLADHLLLLWFGLLSISLTVPRLLMFYPHRPRAALAAHKKFILARLAELLLLATIVALYQQHQTFSLASILAEVQLRPLTTLEHVATVLIALVALIKCAQLPLHGWLIQVVEAPTPVSALLHGGIINLGGFLLILFAPLFSQAAIAQGLVLVWAGLSTLLAALVMATRVSIKVKLAWSTSAQMGLMLVECALGLFHLAWLHLLAHSLYKAYTFLYSGSQVEHFVRQQAAPEPEMTWRRGGFSLLAALAIMIALDSFWPWPHPVNMPVALAMGMTLMLVLSQARVGDWPRYVGYALMVAVGHQGLNSAGHALNFWPDNTLPWAGYWLSLLWLMLFAGYLHLKSAPGQGRFRQYLFAGLFLDEWMTRLTLQIWPTELPERANAKNLAISTKEQPV